ncbi:hypothetical protein CBM2625_B20056 [Cupriavidus taiwanensis]|uniref:Uncharacterized protein n=1 Tax=Cupriavidus taiwanensis TaxID=164546 RepID=A0A976B2F9_9BURK|nr:hypothetical protein CBM2613_B30031 [Cupriavidus taiwanensis]SPA09533.1 hypothetical protein CBM2625_B20056 [Cupriavidus taiwanensis]
MKTIFIYIPRRGRIDRLAAGRATDWKHDAVV